jgi:hypothetical protein
MHIVSTQLKFTKEQVLEFGKITGDSGPIHSIDLIVQGGLIISCLPKILNDIMTRDNINEDYTYSVSMILEAKFRNKLPADTLVTVDFIREDTTKLISRLSWRVYSVDTEYCFGKWVIYKAKR